MRRVLVTIVVLSFTLPAAGTPPPEEQAALIVYEEGRKLFKKRRFGDAIVRFEKAFAIVKNKFVVFYLGRTYAQLGRCKEALPHLSALRGKLPPRQAKIVTNDLRGCRLRLATADAATGRCAEAQVALDGAPAKPSRANAAALKTATAAVAGCWRAKAPFPTRTPSEAAALKLFAAARVAAHRGRLARGIELVQKALSILDAPGLRRELAGLQLRTTGCGPAAVTLLAIPETARRDGDRHLVAACTRLATSAAGGTPAERAHVIGVVAGLDAQKRGDEAAAIQHLSKVVEDADNEHLWTLYAGLLKGAGKCARYAAAVAKVDGAVPGPCGGVNNGLSQTPTSVIVDKPGGRSTRAIWGWVTVGLGVGLVGGGAGLAAHWFTLQDSEVQQAGASTADLDAANALKADRESEGRLTSAMAFTLGGLGLAALGTGIWLLVTDDGPTEPEPATAGAVQLWVGPTGLGVFGRF